MNDRLDQIFSVERLNQRWQKKADTREQASPAHAPEAETDVMKLYSNVRNDILTWCKLPDRERILTLMLDNIKTQLDAVASPDGQDSPPEEFLPGIIEQIQDVESVVEAYLMIDRQV